MRMICHNVWPEESETGGPGGPVEPGHYRLPDGTMDKPPANLFQRLFLAISLESNTLPQK